MKRKKSTEAKLSMTPDTINDLANTRARQLVAELDDDGMKSIAVVQTIANIASMQAIIIEQGNAMMEAIGKPELIYPITRYPDGSFGVMYPSLKPEK